MYFVNIFGIIHNKVSKYTCILFSLILLTIKENNHISRESVLHINKKKKLLKLFSFICFYQIVLCTKKRGGAFNIGLKWFKNI